MTSDARIAAPTGCTRTGARTASRPIAAESANADAPRIATAAAVRRKPVRQAPDCCKEGMSVSAIARAMADKNYVTVNIVEDIIKTVDANPLALEALRARLLTRELLELPTIVARLVESHERLAESHERFEKTATERMDTLESTLREFMRNSNERMDMLEYTLREFMQNTGSAISTLLHDVGVFKGHYARDLAEKMAFSIADEYGFGFKRVLPQAEVWDMINASDTSGIGGDDLRSFSEADLIIQAADADGESCYIVAEVSYTAHWNDAQRAIRNSEFIARFTERPAHPLVAGVDINDGVRQFVIEAGRALWVQLPDVIVQSD